MIDTFDTFIGPLIDREGGYVDDPRDSGGETNFGITVAVARANGYDGPMRDLTKAQAKSIYREQYWNKPGFFRVSSLSHKVAEELLDTGVNMGTKTAGVFFQRCLNALNRGGKDYLDLLVDGSIGEKSMDAFRAYLTRNANGEATMLRALNCLQGARYIELAEARVDNEAFLHGWLAGRVVV